VTEREWLAATDPTPLLQFLEKKVSDRKFRLFGVACCHRIWHLLTDERSRECVAVAECYADGKASRSEVEAVSRNAIGVTSHCLGRTAAAGEAAAGVTFGEDGYGGAYHASFVAYDAFYAVGQDTAEYLAQCRLLREVVGNPFRPLAVKSSWLTSDVIALADGIYKERAFDRMPILADALQDAGCGNAEVLDHCRGPGPHVRGCHVLDLILGKS
jgi:hypothetical protein